MSSKMVQGQGITTAHKERCFRALLDVTFKIWSGPKTNWAPFWVADLHCGSGYNELANCDGSPIAVLDAAAQHGCSNLRAHFCDKDAGAVAELRRHLSAHSMGQYATAYHLNNRDLIGQLASKVEATRENPQYAMGLILADPNGWTKDIPLAELSAFSAKFPRIDVVLNLNARHYACAIRKPQGIDFGYPTLQEIMQRINKNHWLIRPPLARGKGDKFTMIVGRNYDVSGFGELDFHDVQSEQGQEIVRAVGVGEKPRRLGQMELMGGDL